MLAICVLPVRSSTLAVSIGCSPDSDLADFLVCVPAEHCNHKKELASTEIGCLALVNLAQQHNISIIMGLKDKQQILFLIGALS